MSEKLSPLKSPSGLAVTGSGVEVTTFIASSKVPVAVPSDRNSPLLLSLELSKAKVGFLYQGDDRVGAMQRVLDTLAAAKINITAIDAATSGKGRFGAIFWVKPKKVAKAAKLLKAR